MTGKSALLFYADAPSSTSVYLYSSYAPAQRMARSGGITADTTVLVADTITQPGAATSRGPFSGFGVGDILRFYTAGVPAVRKVVTPSTNSSIIIDSAITLAGATAWDWQKASRGLGDVTGPPAGTTFGWVSIAHWKRPTIVMAINSLPTDGFGISIELRDPENQAASVWYQRQYTSLVDFPQAIAIETGASSLRMGLLALDTGSISSGSITASVMDAGVNP